MSPVEIALVFGRLGLMSLGGGLAVLAEMKREIVDVHAWTTNADFWNAYALGQITPGPCLLFVIPLGYRIGGPLIALVATLAFLVPPAVLMFVAALTWRRVRGSPHATRLARALRLLTLGLVAAGLVSIARTSLVDVPSVVLGLACIGALWSGRVNGTAVVLGAGAAAAVATFL